MKIKKKIKNIVAKHCYEFNKPKVEEDKTVYKRKIKHFNKKYVEYFLTFSL